MLSRQSVSNSDHGTKRLRTIKKRKKDFNNAKILKAGESMSYIIIP